MTDRSLRAIPGGPGDPADLDRRQPPHDLPAERALLGTLLTRPDHTDPERAHTAAGELLALLTPDAFYHPAHETIWHAAQTLHAAGTTPDHLALVRHLAATDQLATIGGHDRLLALRDDAAYTADPTGAAADIRTAHLKRTALAAIHRAEHQLHTSTDDPALALSSVMDVVDEALRDTWDPHRHLTTPTSWAPVDLTRVLAGEHLDPPPVMLRRTDGQPLLYDGGIHTISGESESGKAQPYSALVQTPTGPRRLGDLAVGDLILGVDGHPQKVEQVYERGVRQVWEVTTSDGVTVECCDEHLWAVADVNDRHRAGRHRVLTTRELADTVRWPRGTPRWALPAVAAAAYADQDLPLDPYLLGILLGDGHIGRDVRISTGDPEILAAALELAPGNLTAAHNGRHDYALAGRRGHRNPLLAVLRDLGLGDTRSHTNFIPPAYLRGSIDQRLALLQGLMDTDGGIENRGATFTTVSPQLADDVATLIRSLGGTAGHHWRPRYLNGVRHRDACTIKVRLPLHLAPFRLERKAAAYDAHTTRRAPNRTIRDVRPTGRREPMRCIAVSNPDHLYLTNGYVPTHNTWLTLLAVLQLLTDGDKALFVDFEDRADRVIARLLALGATPDQIRDGFSYVRPDRPLDDDGRHQLSPHLTDKRLVVLDGVTEAMTMHGLELNANSDAAAFYGLLPRWIADHGPAVVMIDHVVKDRENQGRFAIGAQHKLAGIDGAAYLVRTITPFSRGKKGVARVDISKDRPGHVREYAHGKTVAEFTLDATSGTDIVLRAELAPPEAGDDRDWEPTGLMEKISRYVQTTPGLSKKSIENAIRGKTDHKRLALELLVTRGYIEARRGARGAIEHHHERVYYQPGMDPTVDDSDTESEVAP